MYTSQPGEGHNFYNAPEQQNQDPLRLLTPQEIAEAVAEGTIHGSVNVPLHDPLHEYTNLYGFVRYDGEGEESEAAKRMSRKGTLRAEREASSRQALMSITCRSRWTASLHN